MTLAKESWPFAAPFALLAALLLATGHPAWAAAALAGGLAILAFFRIPRRRFAGAESIVLAAGNGVVTGVDTIEDPAVGPGSFHRIVTFLSVFDVHVQRIPASGEVVASRYAAGRKVAAFRADAGLVNEQHLTVIRRPNGDLVGVRQIAGLLARRVVCYVKAGDLVTRGGALGLIKFGSRVDLILPGAYRVLVQKGDRLRDGATPVAESSDTSGGDHPQPPSLSHLPHLPATTADAPP